jgi:hypothetical protein
MVVKPSIPVFMKAPLHFSSPLRLIYGNNQLVKCAVLILCIKFSRFVHIELKNKIRIIHKIVNGNWKTVNFNEVNHGCDPPS